MSPYDMAMLSLFVGISVMIACAGMCALIYCVIDLIREWKEWSKP